MSLGLGFFCARNGDTAPCPQTRTHGTEPRPLTPEPRPRPLLPRPGRTLPLGERASGGEHTGPRDGDAGARGPRLEPLTAPAFLRVPVPGEGVSCPWTAPGHAHAHSHIRTTHTRSCAPTRSHGYAPSGLTPPRTFQPAFTRALGHTCPCEAGARTPTGTLRARPRGPDQRMCNLHTHGVIRTRPPSLLEVQTVPGRGARQSGTPNCSVRPGPPPAGVRPCPGWRPVLRPGPASPRAAGSGPLWDPAGRGPAGCRASTPHARGR